MDKLIKPYRFVSSIKLKVVFPEENQLVMDHYSEYVKIKNKLQKICKEFGFSMLGYDTTNDFFKCKTRDHLLESIKQRSKFVIKRLLEEKEVEIISYKVKAILLDSKIDDKFFTLNSVK